MENREFTLSYAYALEEAYKKDNQGFATVEAFAAHAIAAMVEDALKQEGEAFNKHKNNPIIAEYYKTRCCENAVQWILWNIEKSLIVNSGIDDEIADAFVDLIDDNAAAIVEAHPEIVDSDEAFYFED